MAASFCIEQVGVPVLGVDCFGRETWNGESVEARLNDFLSRAAGKPPIEGISEVFDKMELG